MADPFMNRWYVPDNRDWNNLTEEQEMNLPWYVPPGYERGPRLGFDQMFDIYVDRFGTISLPSVVNVTDLNTGETEYYDMRMRQVDRYYMYNVNNQEGMSDIQLGQYDAMMENIKNHIVRYMKTYVFMQPLEFFPYDEPMLDQFLTPAYVETLTREVKNNPVYGVNELVNYDGRTFEQRKRFQELVPEITNIRRTDTQKQWLKEFYPRVKGP